MTDQDYLALQKYEHYCSLLEDGQVMDAECEPLLTLHKKHRRTLGPIIVKLLDAAIEEAYRRCGACGRSFCSLDHNEP